MRKFKRSIVAVSLLVAATAGAAPRYQVTDLTSILYPEGLNNSGKVVGAIRTAPGQSNAALWDGVQIRNLGTLGGSNSNGVTISSAGLVAGMASTPGNTAAHPFLWNGTMRDLGTLGSYSAIYDMNDAGQVVGYSTYANGASRAALWGGTTIRDLGTLGGTYSTAFAVNASSRVVGNSGTTNPSVSRGFLWDGIRMIDLGTLSGTGSSTANDINDAGQITGEAQNASGQSQAFRWVASVMTGLPLTGWHSSMGLRINRAGVITGVVKHTSSGFTHTATFVWEGSTARVLPGLPVDTNWPNDLNYAGWVVGTAHNEPETPEEPQIYRATLWDGAALYALDDLIDVADPLRPYVTLSDAPRINDYGQVAAVGCDSRTSNCGTYLLTPIDSTAPVIVPSVVGQMGNPGWYRSNVSVSFAVTDAEAPIATQTGCVAATVTTDTASRLFTCKASSIGGTSTSTVTVKRDATFPSVNLAVPANGAVYARGSVVKAKYACTDATSGVASCTGTVPVGASIDTSRPVAKAIFTVNATDQAGNKTTVTRIYSVL